MDETKGQLGRPVDLDFVGLSPLEQVGELDNGWGIEVTLTQTRTRAIVSSVRLTCPVDSPQPVTAAAWRAVPIGAVVDEAMANYADVLDSANEQGDETHREWLARWQQAPGSHGHPAEMYARLAQIYLGYVTTGSRSPIEDLSASMETTASTTKQRLQAARTKGLLSGLELTAEAKALLGVPDNERGY